MTNPINIELIEELVDLFCNINFDLPPPNLRLQEEWENLTETEKDDIANLINYIIR